MNNQIITLSQQQRILNLAREVRKSGFADLDQDRVREDFHGLYSDIIQELRVKFNDKIECFYEFSELMNDVTAMVTPEMAYVYGKTAKQAGTEFKQGFMDFMREVNNAVTKSEAAKQRDMLLRDLCEALDDSRGLLTDFIELHAKVNVVYSRIDRFFELGYEEVG